MGRNPRVLCASGCIPCATPNRPRLNLRHLRNSVSNLTQSTDPASQIGYKSGINRVQTRSNSHVITKCYMVSMTTLPIPDYIWERSLGVDLETVCRLSPGQ
jgi:hypothetical protein